jgi:hypothetical protein
MNRSAHLGVDMILDAARVGVRATNAGGANSWEALPIFRCERILARR